MLLVMNTIKVALGKKTKVFVPYFYENSILDQLKN